MSGGMNRPLIAASAVGVVLVALAVPPVASASCNGRPSAANVYSECLAGSKHAAKHKTTRPGSTPTVSTPTVVHVSPQTAKALARAGKQRRILSALVNGYGVSRLAEPTASDVKSSSPTALGSAFDLGSGPTALLLVLAGTAILLLAGTGVRGWRRSHRGR